MARPHATAGSSTARAHSSLPSLHSLYVLIHLGIIQFDRLLEIALHQYDIGLQIGVLPLLYPNTDDEANLRSPLTSDANDTQSKLQDGAYRYRTEHHETVSEWHTRRTLRREARDNVVRAGGGS